MQDVARQLGVSVSSVSRALNRKPGVSAALRQRVQAAAQAVNYRMNPLVSALIRSRRNPHRTEYHATLGLWEPSWPLGSVAYREDYRQLIEGARAGAAMLGYRVEIFQAPKRGGALRRMAQIFDSRAIAGLLLPPLFSASDNVGLETSPRPTIAVGYSQRIEVPRVTHDHAQGVRLAVERCRAIGCRRIGLVLSRRVSEKVQNAWLAAFLAKRETEADPDLLPPLLLAEDAGVVEVAAWVQRQRPQAILGLQHMAPLNQWRPAPGESAGRAVVRVSLDRRESETACAGIDHRHALLGRVAAEQLVHMIERNEDTTKMAAIKLVIEGAWVDGPGF